MKKPAIRAWSWVADHPWAILEPSLQQILDIAARTTEESWEAVAEKLGKPLQATRTVEVRDGIGIVPVSGPIFRYANLFTEYSGATSVEDLATDFRAALDNPAIRAILLTIDSPGGEVSGINEMAGIIKAASAGDKPVIAYVGATAASGAYWLASQARKIVVDPTAMLGSIGTVATIRKKEPKAGITEYEIVSTQSPKKRVDPASEEGRSALQVILDDLAAEFINAVAAGRGVPETKVLADFGQGGMMTARRAIAAGMADSLGSFEGVLAELVGAAPHTLFGGSAAIISKGVHMTDEEKKAAEAKAAADEKAKAEAKAAEELAAKVAEARTEAIKTERARIAGILSLEEAKGREALARTLALESEMTADQAKKILASAPVAGAPANLLATAMTGIANPAVPPTGAADDPEGEKALVAQVLAFTQKGKK
jgi:capsid assembly protease